MTKKLHISLKIQADTILTFMVIEAKGFSHLFGVVCDAQRVKSEEGDFFLQLENDLALH